MRNLILILLFAISLTSCRTVKTVTKTETIYDTIVIKESVKDDKKEKSEVEIIKEIKTTVFLPCPEDDEKGTSGENKSGDNSAKWKYDKEKKGYDVELFCAEQINVKDSIISKLEIENTTLKSKVKKTVSESVTIKQEVSFWDNILKHIWKFLFILFFILWLFGVTPKFLLSLRK